MQLWTSEGEAWRWQDAATATVTQVESEATAVLALPADAGRSKELTALLVAQLFDDPSIAVVVLIPTDDDVNASTVRRRDVARLPNRIALGLSGGGLRAAGFHLGVLMGLSEVGLLPRVRHMSSVSGGSLLMGQVLGAMIQRSSFVAFADHACRFLHEDLSIRPVQGDTPILRAANYYDRSLMGSQEHKTLGNAREVLNDTTSQSEAGWGIEEVVFNATEMAFTKDFVFAISRHRPGRGPQSGTHKARLAPDVVNDIRIADAMAASSAFPGGFGPIRFPDDFRLAEPKPFGAVEPPHGVPIALSDGGVHDNQGIHAMLKAVGRVNSDLDWVVAADVDPGDTTPQLRGEIPGWVAGATLPTIIGTTLALALFGLLIGGSAPAMVWAMWHTTGNAGLLLTAALMPVVVSFALVCGLLWASHVAGHRFAVKRLPGAITDSPAVSPWRMVPAVLLRVRLFQVLGSNAFMTRSRRLHYEQLFGAAGARRRRPYDALAVLISDLPKQLDRHGHRGGSPPAFDGHETWQMSKQLADVVCQARNEPTTLRLGATADERRQRAHVLLTAGRAAVAFKLWKWAEKTSAVAQRDDLILDPRVVALREAAVRVLTEADAHLCTGCSDPNEGSPRQ